MYKTNYFTIKELVHPWILRDIGETNSWMRFDRECLIDLDFIREEWEIYVKANYPKDKVGIYINQGIYDSRGLRPPNDPDGGKYSVHKQGKAFDLVPVNGKHELFWHFVYDLIVSKKLKAFNTMEDRSFTPTWSHLAKMNHSEEILIIKPSE